MRSDRAPGRDRSGGYRHDPIAHRLAAGLCVSVILAACGSSPSSASSTSSGNSASTTSSRVSSALTVSGPKPIGSPTFNNTLYGTGFNLSKVGYEKSQFFVSGTAHAYVPEQPLTSNGQWKVAAGVSAPYETRIAVYRPINPKRFNGTVVVEWLNVSGGTDDSPDWTLSHNELIRDGFAWVGVSAQQVGVNAAKTADPTDYSSLSHPGDSFSYDIFSQAGQAVRHDSPEILGGLRPHALIGVGESQSAGRLMTYIDGIQPIARAVPRLPGPQPIWYWGSTIPSAAIQRGSAESDHDTERHWSSGFRVRDRNRCREQQANRPPALREFKVVPTLGDRWQLAL